MALSELPRSNVVALHAVKPTDSKKPWLYEPDVMEWTDTDTGLKCLIRRVRGLGHLCGYVRIMRDHPLYRKDVQRLNLDVHGGVTFGKRVAKNRFMKRGFWVGFDCAHLYDLVPIYQSSKMQKILGESNSFSMGTYRDMQFVYRETTHLAQQLKLKAQLRAVGSKR